MRPIEILVPELSLQEPCSLQCQIHSVEHLFCSRELRGRNLRAAVIRGQCGLTLKRLEEINLRLGDAHSANVIWLGEED